MRKYIRTHVVGARKFVIVTPENAVGRMGVPRVILRDGYRETAAIVRQHNEGHVGCSCVDCEVENYADFRASELSKQLAKIQREYALAMRVAQA